MKTMMIVTMIASVSTLVLLVAAGGKAQAIADDTKQKLADFTSNPLNAILSLVTPKKAA